MPKDRMSLLRRKIKSVAQYCNDRVDTYYSSPVFKTLKARYNKLNDMIDMRYGEASRGFRSTNSWRSNISMPLVREAYLALRAMATSNFRNDPIVSVQPAGDSTAASADIAQMVIDSNFRETQFRAWAMREIIESTCRFGSAVVVPRYRQEYHKYLQTAPMMIAGQPVGTERIESKVRKNMVRNWVIDIRNYGQDPNIANPYDSPYQFYIDRITLAQFKADIMANKDQYVMDAAKKILEQGEKESLTDEHYHALSKDEIDWRGLDVRYIYTTLPIKGNEDDDTDYLVEMVQDEVVRLTDNPWDYGIRPPTVVSFDKRLDRWYGNTPAEGSVPHENYLNMVLQMAADQGLRELQNYVFYNRALGIDTAQINNHAQNGGWIPMDIKPDQKPNDMFYMFSPTVGNMGNFSYIVQEVKESNQRLQFKPDMQRKSNQGGMDNKTATAAMYLQEEGDIQQNFYLWQFGEGLTEIARKNLVLLQQLLPDEFHARKSPNDPPVPVEKWMMTGEYAFKYQSSMTYNKQIRLMNLFNVLTAVNNFKGAGSPTFQVIRDGHIIRQWLKDALPDLDIDKVAPMQELERASLPPPQIAPGMMPGVPAGAAPPPQAAPVQGVANVA